MTSTKEVEQMFAEAAAADDAEDATFGCRHRTRRRATRDAARP